MTRLFFLLISLWTVPVSFGQTSLGCDETISVSTEKSLKLAGFKCESKSAGSCIYSECTGTLPNYPKPILVAIPKDASQLRLHFHGHKLGVYPEYEKNLTSMVKSFGLNSELCENEQITVFPESDGKCATYDQVLKDKASFETFFSDLNSATGQNLKSLPLHLSAHSGGGRTVARLLNAGFPVNQVTIFDGTYSEEQKKSLKNWYLKDEGKLILATVKGMSPEIYAGQLKKELGLSMKSSKSTIKGKEFDVHQSDRLIHYSRAAGPEGSTKAHYDVLTQTWPASN